MRKKNPSLEDVKSYLSKIWNRQFLTFLFFLLISASFWFFQSINETYEHSFDIPVRLVGVPDNVVVTTEPPSHIRITLKDRGFVLYQYLYTRRLPPIVIKFDDVATASGHVALSTTELLKNTLAALEGSTQLIGNKPESIEFFYNYGQSKRLPVVIQGKISPDSTYTLIAVDVEPRSVLVYASQRILDTLTAAYLEPVRLQNLTDTTTVQQPFIKIPGVKYVPARPKITIITDRMVEKEVEVPIQGVNFPATKRLRTFPSKVKVVFQVGMSQFKKVTPESFVLVVKYEDLLTDNDNRCTLSLKSTPYGVRRPLIAPAEVEYIIEDVTPEEDTDSP